MGRSARLALFVGIFCVGWLSGPSGSITKVPSSEDIWIYDYEEGVQKARDEERPIFLQFR